MTPTETGIATNSLHRSYEFYFGARPMSWKVEIQMDGQFYDNAMRFPSQKKAQAWVAHHAPQLPTRMSESPDPANIRWEARLRPISREAT
jgi:hypothetical protein